MKSTQTVVVFPAPPASMPDELFADFEITGRRRPSAFVASYGILVVVVALLLTLTLTTPAPVLIYKKYSAISLVTPTLSEPAPVRQPVVRISVSQVAVASPKLPVEAPMPIPAPLTPRVEPTVNLPAPPVPKPVLQPNVLAEVPAMPVAKPVHTGSFGDPNGVPVQPQTSATNRVPALAAVGSFGTPATGTGRPTVRGVATGAFGTQSGASGQTSKAVKSVDFSETALAKAKTVEAVVSPISAVAIQSKPAPVYTEEARRLHVQGDVAVQVVFSATGEIRIVGVVKGLGHGLDEAAVAATRQIRFTPARRDGQFVDYPATIHVVFALS
ncbi:MAG: TonB family protein [Terracidiphilus sp.]